MRKLPILCLIGICAVALIGVGLWTRIDENSSTSSRSPDRVRSQAEKESDAYAPEVRKETPAGVLYRFSERQMQQMRNRELDKETLIRFLEARWPIKKLAAYCTPERRFTQDYQNLVPDRLLFDTFDLPMHDDQEHKFDKIFVYVGEENWEQTSYFGDAGRYWRRWSYSLNVLRGDDHWAIIDNLPNDLMDHPERHGAARSQQQTAKRK